MNLLAQRSTAVRPRLARPSDWEAADRNWKGPRWVRRQFYRYQPGAILAICAFLVGVPLSLDWVSPIGGWFDDVAERHPVAVDLLQHVLVALLVAAAAYYSVLGRKRQKALRAYRDRARKAPADLVEWSQGKTPLSRRKMSQLLVDGIERSKEPAVAVVKGRAGTGRTSFVVGLVEDLAERNLIPIPVLASRDQALDFESAARETFCRRIDEVTSSAGEADEIWHRARATRDVVILVDGLNDEVVDSMWQDRGRDLRTQLGELKNKRIAVVLATTRELPLGEIKPLREDLDLLSREEAYDYVEAALDEDRPHDVVDCLAPLRDPVDGFLIAPFYLDVVVRLWVANLLSMDLPGNRDRWRTRILASYLDGISSGEILPPADYADPEAGDLRSRGREALALACKIARGFDEARTDMTVSRADIGATARELADAAELDLLWHGAERIGFASDELGAYLVARETADPEPLLNALQAIAVRDEVRPRGDRHAIVALIFWHQQNPDRAAISYELLLAQLEDGGWKRPALVAGAMRIASSCRIASHSDRLARCADRCIDLLDTPDERQAQPAHAAELLRLVRALAEWPDGAAHRLLWRLATNLDIEVEWPAAKALAMAEGNPAETLRDVFDETLSQAEGHPAPEEMAKPRDPLGNKVASLAWVLPSMRGTTPDAEDQLARAARLCLADWMSPLRGEMSLAQGLKFAILNGRERQNVEHVRGLLFGNERRLRFWHARLVLVQAMLAHAWQNDADARELARELTDLRKREPHLLVRRTIDLSRDGLRALPTNGDERMTKYVWIHEREAVRWVEPGKTKITQLAGDAVLLSNMTYGLRKDDPERADAAAINSVLPVCIRRIAHRQKIIEGCTCEHGLCQRPDDPAIVATRARFSESFCREQARLVARKGPPPWTKRGLRPFGHKSRLESFWDEQADIAQRDRLAR